MPKEIKIFGSEAELGKEANLASLEELDIVMSYALEKNALSANWVFGVVG